MHYTNDQWTDHLVQTDASQFPVQPCLRSLFFTMSVQALSMSMDVAMSIIAMSMGMAMHGRSGRHVIAYPLVQPRQIQKPQKNQHYSNGELHREAYSRRDGDGKQNDCATDQHNGQRVPDTPKNSYQCGATHRALPADNSGNRDNVVSIGRMTHPEEETDRKQRESGTQGRESA
jgi:hypothetical protein